MSLYGIINYETEVEDILRLLSGYNSQVKTVLDIGCGTGNYVIALAQRGFNVTGIDTSNTMLDIARHKRMGKGIAASLLLEDAVTYRADVRFDAVLCLFGVFDYLYEDSKIIEFLKNVQHNLGEDGLFVLDFVDLGFFINNKVKSTVLEGEDANLKSMRISIPTLELGDKLLTLNFKCVIYKGRDLVDFFEESHPLRLFDLSSLTRTLEENGFLIKENIAKGINSRLVLARN